MNPVRPVEDLHEILALERACCEELGEILERERCAASSHDLEALLTTNKERESTQAQWERIAGRRRCWLRGRGVDLEEVVRGNPALEEVRDQIALAAQALRRGQRVNHGLVRAVLGQVSGMIDTIRRELPSSRYDSGAALTSSLPEGGGASWSA